jgi:hypothetical protein
VRSIRRHAFVPSFVSTSGVAEVFTTGTAMPTSPDMNAQRFLNWWRTKKPPPRFAELYSPNQTPRLACERDRL